MITLSGTVDPQRKQARSAIRYGQCSAVLAFFTIAFLMMGAVFLGISSRRGIEDDPRFESSFFDHAKQDSIRTKQRFRAAGACLMVASSICAGIAITLFVVARKNWKSTSGPHQAGPIVSGSSPPPAGYHMQAASTPAYYPTGQQPAHHCYHGDLPSDQYPVFDAYTAATAPASSGAGGPMPHKMVPPPSYPGHSLESPGQQHYPVGQPPAYQAQQS